MLFFSDYHVVNHWIKRLELQESYEICNNLEEFIASNASVKIAFTKGRTFDYDNPMIHDNDLFANYINKLSSNSHLVFSFDTEIHDYYWEIYDKCGSSNVYWVKPGFINDNNYSKNIIPWMYFFETGARWYNFDLTHKLSELEINYNKPLLFDALLGRPRAHRRFVYDKILQNNLQESCILSYQKSDAGNDFQYFWQNFVFEDNLDENVKVKLQGTQEYVTYENIEIALSAIIPIKIYNDAAYSIIEETNCNNNYSFYTEKTSKPFIAKRIFVMFSGWKMLENLRKLGFKTFDSIIDESYDSIENNEERWTAAFEQVLKLSNMDQHIAYSSVNDVIEYNHNHIMNTDWTQLALDKIKQVIYSTNK